ncbi:MAG: SH3 domain-containing protein [Syntrophobacterales bacterium]|jgi:uncharacterized protein YgiM (DUF1202 family)|nr:SH3 domain-containing protein [Syntrophobacterales bacterium]
MKLWRLMIPVMLSPLLVMLASPPAQAYSGVYYIIPTSVPLRECAAPECDVLLTAYQGDKVEILERTTTGWSRVRLVDRAAIGWIRSDQLSYSPDRKTAPMPTYYIRSSVPLRDGPSPNYNTIRTLNFNDPVEMLGVGTSGWAQVRIRESNTVGWVPPRYLSPDPLSERRSPPRRRAPARKAPPPEEKAPSSAPSAM